MWFAQDDFNFAKVGPNQCYHCQEQPDGYALHFLDRLPSAGEVKLAKNWSTHSTLCGICPGHILSWQEELGNTVCAGVGRVATRVLRLAVCNLCNKRSKHLVLMHLMYSQGFEASTLVMGICLSVVVVVRTQFNCRTVTAVRAYSPEPTSSVQDRGNSYIKESFPKCDYADSWEI